jgi:hypothetical protein
MANSKNTTTPTLDWKPEEAKSLVKGLMEKGMTARDISAGVDEHVSYRTIYRWASGDSVPQNRRNFQKLIDFAALHGVS